MDTKPFRLQGIDHVVLRVRDLERALAFYVDVLGCEPTWRREALGLVHLRAGTSMLDLVSLDGSLGRKGGSGPAREGRNVDHVCLRIAPFDAPALAAHFAARGVACGTLAARNFGSEGVGPSLYLEDPDGNSIELKGPPLQRIDVEIDLAAPPARAWRWLTDPALTARYWGGTHIESDWLPGSKIVYRRDGIITDEHVILDVEPARRLLQTFRPMFGEFQHEAPSRVSISLDALPPDGTRLRLVHDGFPADSVVYPACARGWPQILAALATQIAADDA